MCSSYVLSSLSLLCKPHFFLSPFSHSVLISKARDSQVAHGLVLRCFVKRWLRFSVDFPLQMMLAPGAIAVLRDVSFGSYITLFMQMVKKTRPTKPSQAIALTLKSPLLKATRTTTSTSLHSTSV